MSVSDHVVIKQIITFPIPASPMIPGGFTYSFVDGMWVDSETNQPLVQTAHMRDPESKKNDVETGEDQKGE